MSKGKEESIQALEKMRSKASRRWKAYPEYRSSGEDWIGESPRDWRVVKIRHLSTVKRGASPRPIDSPEYFDDDGEYAWVRISDVTASRKYLLNTTQRLSVLGKSKSVQMEPGDLFISIAATVGVPIITQIKCCIHDGFVYFHNLKVNPEYLYYLFAGGELFKGLGKLGTQLNLNTDTIGDIKIPVPGTGEVKAIVSFLDRETARIDALIKEKEKLIDLLEEKRTSMISHAVTKGLNPDAPMKDSGIPWIGKIPAHWQVKKLKYLSKGVGGGTPSTTNPDFWDGDIPWVSPKDMKGDVVEDTEDHISELAVKSSTTNYVPAGTVLIVVRSGILRHTIPVALAARKMTINQDLKGFVTRGASFADYFSYLVRANQQNLLIEWRKLGATVESLEFELMRNSYLPLPPADECRAIAFVCTKIQRSINEIQSDTRRAIALLHEHRTALISAAVTGKIDVRGVAGPIVPKKGTE